MDEALMGKCGLYCGACPTYLHGGCGGCIREHETGDCYSRDCALERGVRFCGECGEFPCEVILTRPRCTSLDKEWLRWKKASKTNR